jgi:hypothetical protein
MAECRILLQVDEYIWLDANILLNPEKAYDSTRVSEHLIMAQIGDQWYYSIPSYPAISEPKQHRLEFQASYPFGLR